MKTPAPRTGGVSLPLWQVLTCVLLAGLFLYNPFLGAANAAGNLIVGHPASHRATVGASELEQFSQPAARVSAALPAWGDAQSLVLQVAASEWAKRGTVEEAVAVPLVRYSSSLWFRPPPAV